ncbi:hypothetical protein T4C_8194, partial [Trichinella pseudospiralis]
LDKIVEGSTMGISSSFQVLVKETACPIRVVSTCWRKLNE